MHVDTAGVMRSLPENHVVDDDQLNRSNEFKKIIPSCFPLSPNSATLKGFRSLLLYRRRLSESVNNRKAELGDITGTPMDPAVFRKTPMYDTLSKRFKSLFIWPAFLATFMPRRVATPQMQSPSKPPPVVQTPVKFFTYLNPNKRMLITPDKVRPGVALPSSSTTKSSRSSNSSHTISSKQQDRDKTKSKDYSPVKSKQLSKEITYRPLFPSSHPSTSTPILSPSKPKTVANTCSSPKHCKGNRKRRNQTPVGLTGSDVSRSDTPGTKATGNRFKKRKTSGGRKKPVMNDIMIDTSSIGDALLSKNSHQSDAPSIIIEESHDALNSSSNKMSLHEIEIKSETFEDSEIFIPKTNNMK